MVETQVYTEAQVHTKIYGKRGAQEGQEDGGKGISKPKAQRHEIICCIGSIGGSEKMWGRGAWRQIMDLLSHSHSIV